MKIDKIRKMSKSELEKELLSLRRDILNLRIKKASDEGVKTHQFRAARKNIAQIKTILGEGEQ